MYQTPATPLDLCAPTVLIRIMSDMRRIPVFVPKDVFAKCPQRMKTVIWLQVIFTPSFYCAPLVFWIVFTRGAMKKVCIAAGKLSLFQ